MMKNAEEVAFTLMFVVIPVVPNGYAGSKIRLDYVLNEREDLRKYVLWHVKRALERVKDTGLKPGSTWDLVVRNYSSECIRQNTLSKNSNHTHFFLLCSNSALRSTA